MAPGGRGRVLIAGLVASWAKMGGIVGATQADFDGKCLALSGKAGTQAVPIGPRVNSALSWYLRHRPPRSSPRPSRASVSEPPGTTLNPPCHGGSHRACLAGPDCAAGTACVQEVETEELPAVECADIDLELGQLFAAPGVDLEVAFARRQPTVGEESPGERQSRVTDQVVVAGPREAESLGTAPSAEGAEWSRRADSRGRLQSWLPSDAHRQRGCARPANLPRMRRRRSRSSEPGYPFYVMAAALSAAWSPQPPAWHVGFRAFPSVAITAPLSSLLGMPARRVLPRAVPTLPKVPMGVTLRQLATME